MKIEAIDLFYVALPEIRRIADSSQDSLSSILQDLVMS